MKKLQLLLIGATISFIAASQIRRELLNPLPYSPAQYVNKTGKTISFYVAGCEDCNDGHFNLTTPLPQIFNTPTGISYIQPVTIITTPPKTIKNIKADLVYFEMKPDNDFCFPCNKDDRLYGHFSNNTNSQQWDGIISNLDINISTPLTPCCGNLFRWRIRYRVEFADCTVCSKLVSYEMRKEGCTAPEGPVTDTNNRIIKSN